MSESMSNVEVEDVLSSIRRLVSDDKAPADIAESQPSSDRLVLTPALRVGENEDRLDLAEPVEEFDEAAIQAWSEFGAGPSEDSTGQSEAEDAFAHQVVGEDFDELDHHDSHHSDAETIDSPIVQVEDDPQADTMADGTSTLRFSHAQVLEHDVDIEAPMDVSPEPLVLDMQMNPAKTPTNPESSHGVREMEAVDEPNEVKLNDNQPISLSAKIAALEAVIGRTDDQWEPDDTGDSDYSGTDAPSMEWSDAEATGTAAQDEASAPAGGGTSSIEDILDEDALRDLVSDIVREELQGALGERITRNVRKLVRREIHRALAAQELE